MLLADEARRRFTFFPLTMLLFGLGLGALFVGMAGTGALREAWLPGALALACLAWFTFGLRHARREGDEIVVRSIRGTQHAPAERSQVALQQGGGTRSPHLDVLLQPTGGPALRLARLEMFGLGGATQVARRLAAVLDVPVHEPSVRPLEEVHAAGAEHRRKSWRFFGGVVAVGVVLSIVMPIVAGRTMATLVIRCPGGQVRQGGATLLDGLEMTLDPGPHAFELHPADGPPWKHRVELVAGRTTVLDCSARPSPVDGAKSGSR